MILTSDASDAGWGTTFESQITGGYWSSIEQTNHINAKELLVAFLALQSFEKLTRNTQILIKIDNVTAVAHINRMGGTKSDLLNHLANFPNLLTTPTGFPHPLTTSKSLHLAAWTIFGNTQEQILCQERLPFDTPKHGDQELEQLRR